MTKNTKKNLSQKILSYIPALLIIIVLGIIFFVPIPEPTDMTGRPLLVYNENIGKLNDISTYNCEGLKEMVNTPWITQPIGAPSDEVLLEAIRQRGCKL